jgi:hypothetical protein
VEELTRDALMVGVNPAKEIVRIIGIRKMWT